MQIAGIVYRGDRRNAVVRCWNCRQAQPVCCVTQLLCAGRAVIEWSVTRRRRHRVGVVHGMRVRGDDDHGLSGCNMNPGILQSIAKAMEGGNHTLVLGVTE